MKRKRGRGRPPEKKDRATGEAQTEDEGTSSEHSEEKASSPRKEKPISFSRRPEASKIKHSIEMLGAEIAVDYPLPGYYEPVVEEMDEFLLFKGRCGHELPRRLLHNWSLYDSQSRLISLESLLLMKPCPESGKTFFGSGNMVEDDGNWTDFAGVQTDGIPICLSVIKERKIDFRLSTISISIRTEKAWYRLGSPAKQYKPWCEWVMRTAKLATCIITLLKNQSRVSRLSFSDTIRKISGFTKNHPSYISSSVVIVEKYVMIQAQIIWQLFAEYPNKLIQRCAFFHGLLEKMNERRHSKVDIGEPAATRKNKSRKRPPKKKAKLTDEGQEFLCQLLAMKKKSGRGRPPRKKAKATEEAQTEDELTSPENSKEEHSPNQKEMPISISRRPDTTTNKYTVKVCKAEITEDYPSLSYYKPLVEEMNENLLFKGGESNVNQRDELPKKLLNNWCLYDSDLRLIPLGLLLMNPCPETDAIIFGSGNMIEDDRSWTGFEGEKTQPSSSAIDLVDVDANGIQICLSAIKEWKIKFCLSTISMWIRTNIAWYQLGKPANLYKPWYDPVMRTIRLAMSIITMLKNQSRISRLSFLDVTRKISGFTKNHPSYISTSMAVVEEYVMVHGQIILQLFSEYPNKQIQRCAFINRLSVKMEERQHAKVDMRKQMPMMKRCRGRPPKKKAKATEEAQKFLSQFLAKKKKRGRGILLKNKAKELEEVEMEDEVTSPEESEEELSPPQKLRKGAVVYSSFSSSKGNNKSKYSIKVCKAKMAEDYLLPVYCKPVVEEMNEHLLFKGGLSNMNHCDDELPRRVLHNWSLYDSESRLIPLDLLPMKPFPETGATFFGSGSMVEDDGSWTGFKVDQSQPSGITDSADVVADGGTPIHLSAIKECKIEFRFPMIFISIRTSIAWYQLGKPAKLYKPWYEPVMKTARLASSIITMLKGQTRVSRLSFLDVIRKISESKKDHPLYISSDMAVVKRYLLVHGHIILQQFSGYSDKLIQRCAFVIGLLEKMKERWHTKMETRKQMGMEKKRGRGSPPKKRCKPIEESQEFLCQHLAMKKKSGRGRPPKNKAKATEEVQMEDEVTKQEESYKEPSPHLKLAKRAAACSSYSSKETNKYYIKIHGTEIAEDYPPPSYYEPLVEEMNEHLFFKSGESGMSIHDDLPRRVLHNWSLYNSESRLIPLELLLIKPFPGTDSAFFGSGSVVEDDGRGFSFEGCHNQPSSSGMDSVDADGTPIYLSEIREWTVKFQFPAISISIRTDFAWYQLGKPAKQYKPWDELVVKTARLVISVITMLKNESRVSRLSFADVIRKISQFKKDHPSYISPNMAVVERYLLVHGQIILRQFSEYPDKLIQRCPFVTGLLKKMIEWRHTKLEIWKQVRVMKKGKPCSNLGIEASRNKVMRATMTKLIHRIWSEYYSNYLPEHTREGEDSKLKEIEEFDDEQEENDDVDILIEEQNLLKLPSSMKTSKPNGSDEEAKWEGKSTGNMISGEALYISAVVRGDLVSVGGSVFVEIYESEDVPAIFFVEYMFEKLNGEKMVHGRLMQRGYLTLLGNAANDREVFLTNHCMEFKLGNVKESVVVDVRLMSWGHEHRKKQAIAHILDKKKAEERKKKGLAMEFYCKCLYDPERGAFVTLPYGKMGLGTGYCSSCRKREAQDYFGINSSKTSFVYKNVEYNVGDYLYVRPQYFAEVKGEHETHKGGRDGGLKAYVVCHFMEIETPIESSSLTPGSMKIKIRRFYRPEDVSAAKAYCSDLRKVYYSEEIFSVAVDMIEGKCEVRMKKDLPSLEFLPIVDHSFFCEYSYDAVKGVISKLPYNVKLMSHIGKAADTAFMDKNGKNICIVENSTCIEGEQDQINRWKGMPREDRLATLDIFAGCGGLSAGFQQSGVSFTKWAIEYDQAAGEAFHSNHQEALMFTDNCNVILRAVMDKCGDADDCISTPEAAELALALDEEKLDNLPMPGQVDFINGGPPCQGFSKLNRFNHGTWSKVQCEMISAYLSFADYFRPRFFLLENVRNFVSFNKGQMFRLTIASLLEMGYQVRFGILEAGAYGVPQSRKRAFIWAASPAETLPEWPEPMHVFAGPELKLFLPGGVQYAAVKSTAEGAPFRSITVRDTIGDLPAVQNGASKLTIDYQSNPVSWFQKQIRGSMMALNDHISKEMSEVNLIRCQQIPKCIGGDWRSLPNEKVKLSNGRMVNLIPCFIPKTAKRHNGWKGVFGRLDWEGHFPTSITDPQPAGKVGKCFHPEQDRIITVRECARSQGFPDSYRFSGNIQDKHRQIGNAVPPPLAYALGRKLKEALDARCPST